jgi:hypothetical protein
MFIKYLEGLKPLKITAKSKILNSATAESEAKTQSRVIFKHLQMGERTMTAPMGYRKNVVLSRKGNTAKGHRISVHENSLQSYLNLEVILGKVNETCFSNKKFKHTDFDYRMKETTH